MTFANTSGGLDIDLSKLSNTHLVNALFAENPGVVIQVADDKASQVRKILEDAGVGYLKIGQPTTGRSLHIKKDTQEFAPAIDRQRTPSKASTAKPRNATTTTPTSP